MSWETLSKENAMSMAELWLSNGKSKTVVREHLVTKGLTYPEADDVLAELSGVPPKVKKDFTENVSLGSLASDPIIQEETPLSVAQTMWRQGKSTTFIRKFLVNTGSSNTEANEVLAELSKSSSDKAKTTLGNYGSLGQDKQKPNQDYYQGASNTSSRHNTIEAMKRDRQQSDHAQVVYTKSAQMMRGGASDYQIEQSLIRSHKLKGGEA